MEQLWRAPKLTGRLSARRSGWIYLVLVLVIVISILLEKGKDRVYESALVPGEPMPEYAAVSLDGTEVSIQEFGGKVLLLNFWATWCSACTDQLPELQDLRAELGGQGLELVTVSLDDGDPSQVQSYLDALGYEWPNLFDDPSHVSQVFGWGDAIPKTILVNRDGSVGVWWRGRLDPNLPENRALLEDAISGRAVWRPPT